MEMSVGDIFIKSWKCLSGSSSYQGTVIEIRRFWGKLLLILGRKRERTENDQTPHIRLNPITLCNSEFFVVSQWTYYVILVSLHSVLVSSTYIVFNILIIIVRALIIEVLHFRRNYIWTYIYQVLESKPFNIKLT